MSKLYRFLIAGLALTAAPAVQAQDKAAACEAIVAPTGVLAPWTAPVAKAAARDAKALNGATLEIGQAARLALSPTPDVRYPLRPEKPGGSVSHGGLVQVEIKEAATYRIALSSGAWIDVVRGKAAETSTAHGPGPACSGVRKMVDFALKPGRYTVQLAANGDPEIVVLVARLP